MRRLIVRADDLGISEAVTLGCLSAVRDGIVTSSGMIVNMEYSGEAARRVREYPQLCLGLHINLIVGKPCAPEGAVRGLLNDRGEFVSSKDRRQQVKEGVDLFIYEEVLAEVEAQIIRFKQLNGKPPEYMDCHSVTTPTVGRAIQDLAKKYGIEHVPICGNGCVAWKRLGKNPTQYEFYKRNLPLWKYLEEDSMQLLEGETGLLVMHPGFLDQKIMDISSMTFDRMKDHDFLVSPEVKQWIDSHGISLVSFREL